MSTFFLIFTGLLGVACLLIYLWQMRAALLPRTLRERIIRAVLSGFLLNLGFVSLLIFRNLLSGQPPITLPALGSFELIALPLQAILTWLTYTVYKVKLQMQHYLETFEKENPRDRP